MSFSNHSVSRPVTPPPRPTTPVPDLPESQVKVSQVKEQEGVEHEGEQSLSKATPIQGNPSAFKGLEPKTGSLTSDESLKVGESGLEQLSGSQLLKRSQSLPSVSGLSEVRSVEKAETLPIQSHQLPDAPPSVSKPKVFSREELGKHLIAPHFFENARELEKTYFFKKPVLARAQAKAADISKQLMRNADFKLTMAGMSDEQLKETVAQGIALTKPGKYQPDTSYAQLSSHKQKLVDAIVAGLKAGLSPDIQVVREQAKAAGSGQAKTVLDQAEARLNLKDELQRHQLKPSQQTLAKLDQLAGNHIEILRGQLKQQHEALRSELQYKDLPTPDPSDVSMAVLDNAKIRALFGAGPKLRHDAEALIHAYSGPDKAELLISITTRPFDTLVENVGSRMYSGKMNDEQRARAKDVALAMVQGAMKEMGHATGNELIKSDGDGNPEQVTIKNKEFSKVRQLGEGGFGRAFLFRASDGEEVVVKKFLRKDSDEEHWFRNMQKEIRAHHYAMGKDGTGHENILGLKGVVVRPPGKNELFGEFFTVTEAAKGGELRDLMEQLRQQLLDKRISREVYDLLNRQLFAQIVEGMQYVQKDRQMLHMDLKPENVFMTSDGTVKVADFGLAHIGHNPNSVGGTQTYMSPEVANIFLKKSGKQVDFHTDTWTLGVMAKELFSNDMDLPTTQYRMDFSGFMFREVRVNNPLEDAHQFAKDDSNRVYSKGDKLETGSGEKVELQALGGYHQLVNAMLNPDPSQRPTLDAVRNHHFVSDPILGSEPLRDLLKQMMTRVDELSPQQLKQHYQKVGELNDEVLKLARH